MKFLRKVARPVVDRFPSLARAYRYVRDSRALGDQAVATPFGFRFLGNRVMQEGRFEPEETRLVSRLLPKVDVVVDVGANVGYYCCLARAQGKPVIAFEPIWLNAQYLLRNIESNEWRDGVEVFMLAASDQVGVAKIFGGGTGASLVKGWANTPATYVTYVPTSTLDVVLASRLNGKRTLFIVDVEGAEDQVIRGAATQLGLTPRPVWMIEIIATQAKGIGRNPKFCAPFEAFWAAGYEAWTATSQPRLVTKEMVDQFAAGGVDTINSPNIVFVEEGKGRDLLF